MKVIISNFKVWVFENLEKSKRDQGPLVSVRHRLTGRPVAGLPRTRQLLGHHPPPHGDAVG
jgi:hypothetical protein